MRCRGNRQALATLMRMRSHFLSANLFIAASILSAAPRTALAQQDPVHLTHEFTNTDAQSLIGLPMGTYKTIVTKQGYLRWSHWNLKNKPINAMGSSASISSTRPTRPRPRHSRSRANPCIRAAIRSW
jgi:hypothetical protein